jgi:hypothetical protein
MLEFGVIVGGPNVHVSDVAGTIEQAKLTWLVYEPFGVTVKL